MPASIIELEKRLWGVADELRANSLLSFNRDFDKLEGIKWTRPEDVS